MGKKRQRAKGTSSGARKARAYRIQEKIAHQALTGSIDGIGKVQAGPGRIKRQVQNLPVNQFLKVQARDRWPTEASKQKAWELLQDKTDKAASGRARPLPLPMPMLETLAETSRKALAVLLTAASLRMKRSRRHPGWYLQKTYNHGTRVIEII